MKALWMVTYGRQGGRSAFTCRSEAIRFASHLLREGYQSVTVTRELSGDNV